MKTTIYLPDSFHVLFPQNTSKSAIIQEALIYFFSEGEHELYMKKLIRDLELQKNARNLKKLNWFLHTVRNLYRSLYQHIEGMMFTNGRLNMKAIRPIIDEWMKLYKKLPEETQKQMKEYFIEIRKMKKEDYLKNKFHIVDEETHGNISKKIKKALERR